jgi:hypothetical protein
MLEKEKLVIIIEDRIRDEYNKHKSIDWIKIASLKIAVDIMQLDFQNEVGKIKKECE